MYAKVFNRFVISGGRILKVLIVNENTLVSQAMRAILESHDFEVSLCAYALQARGEQLGTAASGRPDVALVDIRVPDSGGIEARMDSTCSRWSGGRVEPKRASRAT